MKPPFYHLKSIKSFVRRIPNIKHHYHHQHSLQLQLQKTSPSHLTMASSPTQARPPILGIHHIKFAVSNLSVSLAWYERVVGAKRIPHLDHIRSDGTRFAAVCEMPEWSGLYLELRQTSDQAFKERGWDPVTLSVQGREDLIRWIEWLERWQTVHSPLLTGVRGWLLVFEVDGCPF
jgi:hypothetical protein